MKKAIRPAGRQAVPTDERRNGRGHRHDGMSAKKKRYLMLKKAIRQAGRQEGPRNEIRHGRSHRHVGIQTKKIRSMRWSGRKAGRIGRG